MAYESKVMVFEVTKGTPRDFGELVCEVKMGACGYDNGWRELFTKSLTYNVWYNDDLLTKDCYGAPLKACPIADVIAWLEKELLKEGIAYRRFEVLYGLLKGFNPEKWERLEVVHYGY